MSPLSRLRERAVRHPRTWLAASLAVAALLAAGGLRLELRGSAPMPATWPEPSLGVALVDHVRFGDAAGVGLRIRVRPGAPALDEPEGSAALARLVASLEPLAAIDGAVLPPGSLIAELPLRPEATRVALERFALEVDPGGLDARLALPIAPEALGAATPALRTWIAEHGDAFDLRLAGPLAARALREAALRRDLRTLAPAGAILSAGLLTLAFGIRAAAIVGLFQSLVVALPVLGALGWLGIPFTPALAPLPPLLVAVGAIAVIPLLERLRATLVHQSLRHAVLESSLHFERAGLASGALLALGLGSLASSDESGARAFGLAGALGVAIAVASAGVVVPALLVALPRTWARAPARDALHTRLVSLAGYLATALGRVGMERPLLAAAVGTLLLGLTLPGLARLELVAKYPGQRVYEIVIGGRPGWLASDAGRQLLAKVEASAARAPGTRAVLVGDSMAPASTRLRLSTPEGDALRIRLLPEPGSRLEPARVRDHLDATLPILMRDAPVTWHYGGGLTTADPARPVLRTVGRSLTWTLLAGLLLGGFLLGRAGATLLALAPALAALVFVLGAMGWLGRPLHLEAVAAPTWCAALGTGFAFHWLERWQRIEVGKVSPAHAGRLASGRAARVLRWQALAAAGCLGTLAFSNLGEARGAGALLVAGSLAVWAAVFLVLPLASRLLGQRALA